MLSRIAIAGLLVAAFAMRAPAQDKKTATASESGKQTALDAFKRLAGQWSGKESSGHNAGMDVRATYKVTSGGSAVMETMFPGSDHEMITVIHPDGDDLVLTHYCMLGNQPQMRAPGKLEGNQVAFKFERVTNLKSDNAMYMHNVTFTFVDADTLRAEWTHYQNGKPGGPAVFELKRQK